MIRAASRGFSPSEPGAGSGLDTRLLIGAVVLLFFGLASLYSIDFGTHSTGWFKKQLAWTVIGLVPFVFFLKVPGEVLRRIATPLYIVNLVLLLGVIVFGSSAGGAQRWLDIGPIRFQPSEFSKIALAL